jgi:hypothetical protein
MRRERPTSAAPDGERGVERPSLTGSHPTPASIAIIALFGHALARGTDARMGRGPVAPSYPHPLSTMGMNYKGVVRGSNRLIWHLCPPELRLISDITMDSRAVIGSLAQRAAAVGIVRRRGRSICRQ